MSEDNKEFSELLQLLEKLTSEANSKSMDAQSEDELDSLVSMSFDDLSQEFIKESKTKLLKVKKINSDAILPSYNYPSDSGFDLYSTEEIVIPALGRALIPTGLSFQFSEGYEIQIRTKSGLAINQGIMVLNSPGTVDQGYSGEIKVPIFNTNPSPFTIKKNMKVAQAVLCPVVNGLFVKIEEVDTFEETDRGDNGFGSTGI
jgi:dUTP pyrophosphatase